MKQIFKRNLFLFFTCFLFSCIACSQEKVDKSSNINDSIQLIEEGIVRVGPNFIGSIDNPLTTCDTLPKFPGGEKAFHKYIKSNLIYPQYEKENRIQGYVYIKCIVDSSGGIQKAKIARGVPNSKNLEVEALRIVNSLPKWKPAIENGKKINFEYVIPIEFKL